MLVDMCRCSNGSAPISGRCPACRAGHSHGHRHLFPPGGATVPRSHPRVARPSPQDSRATQPLGGRFDNWRSGRRRRSASAGEAMIFLCTRRITACSCAAWCVVVKRPAGGSRRRARAAHQHPMTRRANCRQLNIPMGVNRLTRTPVSHRRRTAALTRGNDDDRTRDRASRAAALRPFGS